MTTYTITIDGTSRTISVADNLAAGLTAAMQRANDDMPATIADPNDTSVQIANPALYANEAAYLGHVLQGFGADFDHVAARALRSYAIQAGADPVSIPDPDAEDAKLT